MKRLNFTLDEHTIELLDELSNKYYEGNKSQTVRVGLESLKAHIGNEGWVIGGYTPIELVDETECRNCGKNQTSGDVAFKPVFEKGNSVDAMPTLPKTSWVACDQCISAQ